jgi:LmbE family N-acetylglucosaminyl deacetylase
MPAQVQNDALIPDLTALPEAASVVVIAPHPDDDVLGCGGTIARLCEDGCTIQIIYVTDGAASHIGSPLYPPTRLRRTRMREATAAAGYLGLASTALEFWAEPDSGLSEPDYPLEKLVLRFARTFRSLKPMVVLAPWIRDKHSDHALISRAVRAALHDNMSTYLFEYDVWPAVDSYPFLQAAGENLQRVNVSTYRGKKSRALAEHRSQLGSLIWDADEAFTLPDILRSRVDDVYEHFAFVPYEQY